MANLTAAARGDVPGDRDDFENDGVSNDVPADDDAEDEAEPRPYRTGGWIPANENEAATTNHRFPAGMPRWIAARLPESPRLGIALGAGIIVLVIMLAAGGYFAVRFALQPPESHPVGAPTSAGPRSAPPSGPAGQHSSPSGRAASPAVSPRPTTAKTAVTVQVVGAVQKPAVVTLAAGSRVIDAVKSAGGVTAEAYTAGVNMARTLVDGEQIRVPKRGEENTTPVPQPPGAAGRSPTGAAADDSATVNLNTAGEQQLETLPNIGPVTANKIIDWRTDNDGFSSIDDLLDVPGIGPKTFAEIKDRVTI